ncbi:hypothetical protein FXF68_07650 [Actinomadura decatromicini]|uniref:Cytoskeleton protein RodZ-like C-terminal domain-containing protein n=1 Tax=Actinomadura decatromicini TaxID=2604572 RepID=A0A5D3FPY2_9ACTN|nr:hypothetical protein FXF68_07650 [Actinomadura decatromicini]
MGRHRSDPRGLARILIAAVAVIAALALLVVGAVALVNAVTGEPDPKGPSAAVSPSDAGAGSRSSDATASPTVVLPLVIRVIGPATAVVVRIADTSGRVLTNGTLKTGETLQYREAPLQVVATNGGSLQVVIYGKLQPREPAGERAVWFVKSR